jgi:subtilase-type serine protease
MRLHFSSASTLALATAATLALPYTALAADYAIRNGQRVAASLEAPVEAAAPGGKAAQGQFVEQLSVQSNQYVTNNDQVRTAISQGNLTNNGRINQVDMNGGTVVNNQFNPENGNGSIFYGNLNAGSMVNNGSLYSAQVKSGATLVSNENATSRYISNSGTVTNHGTIGLLSQQSGTFTNSDKGRIDSIYQEGGTVTNGGKVALASVAKGTFQNLESGVIDEAKIGGQIFNGGGFTDSAGTFDNSGRIKLATVEKLGTLNNNAGGVVDTLTNAGTVLNNGQIGTVTQTAGNLTNNGTILGKTTLGGGILTNKKFMGTLETNAGTSFFNDGGTVRSLTNNGISVNNGSIQNVSQLGGTFTNDANGNVYGLSQDGGVSTNDGNITYVNLNAGTVTNNASGKIAGATVSGGALLNGGSITNITVLDRGSFTNNQAGTVSNLNSSGNVANAGQITKVDSHGILANAASGIIDELKQGAGTTTNDGIIKLTTIEAGTLTNNGTGVIGIATLKHGALLNSGKIGSLTVEELSTFTNNLSGTIDALNNAGTVGNAGQIGSVNQIAGSLTNNGTILGEASITGGALTNNKALGSVIIAEGATFVNNNSGIARALNNSGTATNDGIIGNVEQKAGTLVNEANGTFAALVQSGGATTNNGSINQLMVEGGSLVNNENGKLGQADLKKGSLQNSGKITDLNVGNDAVFANNDTGLVDQVTSLGTGSNGGNIGRLMVAGGTFNNSGTVTENVIVGGGRFISTGIIGGSLHIAGTKDATATADLSGAINGGLKNTVYGGLNLKGNLTGHGKFINEGTMASNAFQTISGFDTFVNTGSLSATGGLEISGNVVSSGKIEIGSDASQYETIKAGGTLTLTSSSETSINLNSTGNHDTLSAGGDLSLGGTLKVNASGETYGLKTTFQTFTTTTGKVVGQFTDVIVSGAASLFGTVEDSAAGLVLALRNRDVLNTQLKTLELGANEHILTGLEYKGKDGAVLFDTLATVNAAEAPGLIAQITGAASSAVVNVGNNAAKGFGNLMQKVATASGLRRSNDGVLAYEKARRAEEGRFEPVLGSGQGAVGFWARGFGETGTGAGGDATIGGLGAGADVALGESLTIGASAGYSMARFGHGKAVTGKTNSFHGGGYIAIGATAPEATGFGLTASGSYSKHATDQERVIKIGALTSIAKASYGGTTIAGEVMVRNGFTIGGKVPLTIAPVAGLKFGMDNDEGYTETGAGGLNLTVSGAKRRSLVGVVGLQLASRIETESVVFIPHVSGVYQHEFLDTSSTTTRTLSGSATPFTVKQGDTARSSVAVEAGLGLRFAGGLAVDVSGYGVFAGAEKRYGATATLKAGF